MLQKGVKVDGHPLRGWSSTIKGKDLIVKNMSMMAAGLCFLLGAMTVFAQDNADLPGIVPYEAMNVGEPNGDKLTLPRQIAAVVVAQDNPSPKMIVDVGSHTGEFLEAFLDRFPAARGQWTEPVEESHQTAERRLARFGDRVDYVIGCPARDISDGCVPTTADVIITSWISVHQPLEGIQKFYKNAYAQLPSGGWLANLDHVTIGGEWDRWFKTGRLYFQATKEGPSPHLDTPPPTLDEQVSAIKAAGFDDVQVVWQSFCTALFMAHKN